MRDLKDYQKRVIVEKEELDVKLEKLNAFLETDQCAKLGPLEKERLRMQCEIMTQYSEILGGRIDDFKEKPNA